jgi:dynein light intermediate chain
LQVKDLELEKSELERTVNDMTLKFEVAEKQATEQKQVEEKKHNEEIQFLKRTNQQLKVCLYKRCALVDLQGQNVKL